MESTQPLDFPIPYKLEWVWLPVPSNLVTRSALLCSVPRVSSKSSRTFKRVPNLHLNPREIHSLRMLQLSKQTRLQTSCYISHERYLLSKAYCPPAQRPLFLLYIYRLTAYFIFGTEHVRKCWSMASGQCSMITKGHMLATHVKEQKRDYQVYWRPRLGDMSSLLRGDSSWLGRTTSSTE
ncbi:hypothetical protein HZ326_19264 [Fusarium oxysporum f. sp. albedinis]|nr:hypothetical protein HZ326_19264 [Fusarium oxysporum f. sp. albedinis]